MTNPSQFSPPPRNAPQAPPPNAQNPQVAEPRRELRRIGLWGAPESGKTTFLAALQVAILRSPEQWMLYGVNEESNDFLDVQTGRLTQHRQFPSATVVSGALSWTLRGTTTLPTGKRWGRRSRTFRWRSTSNSWTPRAPSTPARPPRTNRRPQAATTSVSVTKRRRPTQRATRTR
ncbi:hypothetical protein GEV43_11795 [Actinomadura sp. J1-007]|uniref:hypothetical protein n=1 Tax=Actinomadura sp. J1-007 TaxID=2661913 RepID=UPI001320637F|nr:hypothetical protein [Actinomadura sp. J1-007]MWK34661.1 hypothetical protein [Actinomadura sp. J1-007]